MVRPAGEQLRRVPSALLSCRRELAGVSRGNTPYVFGETRTPGSETMNKPLVIWLFLGSFRTSLKADAIKTLTDHHCLHLSLVPLLAGVAVACVLFAVPVFAETPAEAHTNRLIDSVSPYLLQHAHNPVDWYPWGEEAIGKARKENKLIFLSI